MNAPFRTSSYFSNLFASDIAKQEGATPSTDRRRAPRAQTALRGEVVVDGRSYPGQISSISLTGLTLSFERMPPVAKGIQLLVKTGALEPISGTVRWVGSRECGLAFNAVLAQEVIVDSHALFDPGKRVRPGRARVKLAAIVRSAELCRKVTIDNIGSGGALLTSGLSIGAGRPITIEIDGVAPINGYVRWSKSGLSGVMFSELLPVAAAEEITLRCGVHPSWLNEVLQAHAVLKD